MNNKTEHAKSRAKISNLLNGHWKVVAMLLTCYDMTAVVISYFLALWLRFDCRFSLIEIQYLTAWKKFIPIYMAFCLLVFLQTKIYNSIWKYASYSELLHLMCILRRRTDTGAFAGGHSAALADIDFFCLSGYFSFNNDIVVLRYPFKHGVG